MNTGHDFMYDETVSDCIVDHLDNLPHPDSENK